MQDPLTMANYTAKFQALLHVEELQMEIDIRQYDMKAAQLRRCDNPRLLALTVPGLAESRPSLLRGCHSTACPRLILLKWLYLDVVLFRADFS